MLWQNLFWTYQIAKYKTIEIRLQTEGHFAYMPAVEKLSKFWAMFNLAPHQTCPRDKQFEEVAATYRRYHTIQVVTVHSFVCLSFKKQSGPNPINGIKSHTNLNLSTAKTSFYFSKKALLSSLICCLHNATQVIGRRLRLWQLANGWINFYSFMQAHHIIAQTPCSLLTNAI